MKSFKILPILMINDPSLTSNKAMLAEHTNTNTNTHKHSYTLTQMNIFCGVDGHEKCLYVSMYHSHLKVFGHFQTVVLSH